MTNRDRFLAGHIFTIADMESRYQYQSDPDSEFGSIARLTLKRWWLYYGNVDNLTIDKFTIFYLFFNELVSANLTFSELIFLDEKGETPS